MSLGSADTLTYEEGSSDLHAVTIAAVKSESILLAVRLAIRKDVRMP
jgi:hypothetical protein